ncbi:MAG: hydroxymethylglutaryl-CoA lyase [Chloroflexi bacterium]|nr:hydroxymethylglutaryl-CoA lyase [Chloroflexota bacterium]
MRYPSQATIIEVGPRDGLQNEAVHVPTDAKVRFVDMLSDAGLPVVEVTSFVHPKAVPRMADAHEVLRAIRQKPGVRYPVLVPNSRGLERALAAGAREIALFTAATESFTRANINRTIDQSIDDARAVIQAARPHGARIRAYVSTAFACPFEGPVPPEQVAGICARLLDAGAEQIGLGDTIGAATPADVSRLLDRVLGLAPLDGWGMHFHDTRGTALANVVRSLDYGIAVFDSAAGGLGGCPFAGPNATGNLATEDLVYLLDGLGVETGVSLPRVMDATRFICARLDHAPTSKVFQAGGRLVPKPLATA